MSYQNPSGFCSGCGGTLQAGWNACPRCGTPVGAPPVQQVYAAPVSRDFGFCSYHPSTPALFTCEKCGRLICQDCTRYSATGRYGYVNMNRMCKPCDEESRAARRKRMLIFFAIFGVLFIGALIFIIIMVSKNMANH